MKQFLSHLSLLMLLNLLIKPVYLLVVDARIQDVLGPEEFGRYFPLLSLSILLNIVLDAGLSNHMTRLISSRHAGWQAAYSAGWKAKGVLIPLYFIVLMATGWALGYRGESLEWLAWVGLNQVLLSGVLFIRAGLQGLGAHRTDAWVSILDRSLLLVGLGILLAIQPGFQIVWLLGGTSIALLIAGCLALWRLRINRLVAENTASEPTNIWTQLAKGWPYASTLSADDDLPPCGRYHVGTIGHQRSQRSRLVCDELSIIRSRQHDWLPLRYPITTLLFAHAGEQHGCPPSGHWSQSIAARWRWICRLDSLFLARFLSSLVLRP